MGNEIIAEIVSNVKVENQKRSYLEFKDGQLETIKAYLGVSENKKVAVILVEIFKQLQKGKLELIETEKKK